MKGDSFFSTKIAKKSREIMIGSLADTVNKNISTKKLNV